MKNRPHWLKRISDAWAEVSLVWLCGVRRSGKTVIAKMLSSDETLFLNCDLPSVGERVRNPVLFFQSVGGGRGGKSMVVFDEIHQLPDPSRLLKIGTDEFPRVKILATGSSTLSASRKFRDTLTGRKRDVRLTPVTLDELEEFGVTLEQRMYHGGLPSALMSANKEPSFYREWLDSYFARDIQYLHGVRDMQRFNALFEYLLRMSGGQFDSGKTAAAIGISRPTLDSHLRILESTHTVTLLRPFSSGHRDEIVRQPKVYGFDTGFVSFARGWDPLRPEDFGNLWEHLVLEWIQAHQPGRKIHYWRDKQGNEIDFVIPMSRDKVDVIECKWNPGAFERKAMQRFRQAYPRGRNWLLSPGVTTPYERNEGGLLITVASSLEP